MHTFNPNTWDRCLIEASLGYIANSRPAWATQPCLKNKKQANKQTSLRTTLRTENEAQCRNLSGNCKALDSVPSKTHLYKQLEN